MTPKPDISLVSTLASQLNIDLTLLFHEVFWALGEERINKVTPSYEKFRAWTRRRDGLNQFWTFANTRLSGELAAEDVRDIWECIDLTLNARKRHAFSFQDYLIVAVRAEAVCEYCGKGPPEVRLDIDHVLPVSRGGSNTPLNLRFLCEHHNRSRGNRFRWADVWRRAV